MHGTSDLALSRPCLLPDTQVCPSMAAMPASAILEAIDTARWPAGNPSLELLEEIRIGSTGAVNLLLSRTGRGSVF